VTIVLIASPVTNSTLTLLRRVLYSVHTARLRIGRSGVPLPVGARDSDRFWGSPKGLRGGTGVKQPGRKAEIQNERGYASIPPHDVHRDCTLTFNFINDLIVREFMYWLCCKKQQRKSSFSTRRLTYALYMKNRSEIARLRGGSWKLRGLMTKMESGLCPICREDWSYSQWL
jgi:hypothetical protein